MSGSASRERLCDPLRDVVVVTLDELVNTVLVQLTDLVKQRHCTASHTSSQHTHVKPLSGTPEYIDSNHPVQSGPRSRHLSQASRELHVSDSLHHVSSFICRTLTKERRAWCCLQVKLCDPCLSALGVCVRTKMALYKYSSFPFLYRYVCVCLCVCVCVPAGSTSEP